MLPISINNNLRDALAFEILVFIFFYHANKVYLDAIEKLLTGSCMLRPFQVYAGFKTILRRNLDIKWIEILRFEFLDGNV